MQRIAYQSIDLKSPVRVFRGRTKVTSVESVKGACAIFRVFDGPLDFFVVEGPQAIPGVEIESSNVAAGARADVPSVKGKGGKAKKNDDDGEDEG